MNQCLIYNLAVGTTVVRELLPVFKDFDNETVRVLATTRSASMQRVGTKLAQSTH